MLCNPENIPEELKKTDQWVCWRGEPKGNGKLDKIPVDAKTGSNASSTNPATWATFTQAVDRAQTDQLSGIGFVFTTEDDFAGVDLDECIDPATNQIRPKALEVLQSLNSYAEVSPSLKGIKVFVKGRLPGSGKQVDGFEMYDSGRFFTVTGLAVEGLPRTVEARQEAVSSLYSKFFGNGADHDLSPSPAKDLALHGQLLDKCYLLKFCKEKADQGVSLSHTLRIAIGSYAIVLGDLDTTDMPFLAHMLKGCPDFKPAYSRRQLESIKQGFPWGCEKIRKQVVSNFSDFEPSRCNCQLQSSRKPTPLLHVFPELSGGGGEDAQKINYLPLAPHMPLDSLHEIYARAVEEIAAAYSVSHDVPYCVLLSVAGACIGRTRGIRIKASWVEHANLWIALVGRSGTGKSPAAAEIQKPVFAQEKIWFNEYQEALALYQAEMDARKNTPKKDRDALGQLPEPPQWRQLFVDDATTESVGDALDANPRGILWLRDELAGLILDLDRYTGKDGATKSRLIQGYQSGIWKINRIGKKKLIPHAALSIFGSIQPAVLPRIFSKGDADSGFLPRFLFVSVDRDEPQVWTEEFVSETTSNTISSLIAKLLSYEFHDDGQSVITGVTRKAKDLYVSWFNEQALEPWLRDDGEEEESVLAKLRGQCLRVALILHCMESIAKGTNELLPVSGEVMQKAITLMDVLKQHQKRAWRFFKDASAGELSSLQKRVLKAILALEESLQKGILPTKRITDHLNDNLPERYHISEDSIGKILSGFGLSGGRVAEGRGFVVTPEDMERFRLLLKSSGLCGISGKERDPLISQTSRTSGLCGVWGKDDFDASATCATYATCFSQAAEKETDDVATYATYATSSNCVDSENDKPGTGKGALISQISKPSGLCGLCGKDDSAASTTYATYATCSRKADEKAVGEPATYATCATSSKHKDSPIDEADEKREVFSI
jgi:hypothetical protein